MPRCECGAQVAKLHAGLCAACYLELVPVVDVVDDGLVTRIADSWHTCMVCDQPIDGPGCCPRHAEELRQDFKEMGFR